MEYLGRTEEKFKNREVTTKKRKLYFSAIGVLNRVKAMSTMSSQTKLVSVISASKCLEFRNSERR